MSQAGPNSGRALVLAPLGRDAMIAAAILREAGVPSLVCPDIACLCREMEAGAAVALVAEEALTGGADVAGLSQLIGAQPEWSDFPFLLLSLRGGGPERNPAAGRLMALLGNVTFLERPFHPTTLVSLVQSALRSRSRQYEARGRIAQIREGEALLEARVQERTAELAAANQQLADQIAERERIESALRQAQRLEAVGQLTSGVAHDFNNLLTIVLGNVRQLQKAETDPKAQRRLDMMAQAGERGARLTSQLLAFSRRQKLEPRAVDLNDTVQGMRDLLHSTLGGSVRIDTALQDNLWPAMIDPTQIELVILNLAINARDAMQEQGDLVIQTANVTLGRPVRPEDPLPGDYVMVAVTDNGPGMSAEVLLKAFEPFFTTKEIGKGTGLGLSQVFGLARQSGGGVRIDTGPGQGCSVKVYLPRAAVAAQPAEHDSRPALDRSVKNRLILVVDDENPVREITTGVLRDLGYRVVEAGSGPAALDLLASAPDVDLLLLDFAMPGMNGAELAREVRTRRPDLPILFATGYADTAALTQAGENHIVQKPFTERDLAEKVAERLAG